jgi:geranylgeranyl reductase family protein
VIRCDALIVGGGPGGSTAARLLRRAGWDVVVADRARFPRDKVCAGWLTPEVFPLLDLTPTEYQAAGLTFQEITAFRTSVMGGRAVETRYARVASYAIRRCEFDTFLLRRAGARVLEDVFVRSFRRDRDRWIVNESIEAPVVIGAGGHFCPVARHLRGNIEDRDPIVAKEAEFPLGDAATQVSGTTPELYFCRDLQGYAWCVRKGGYMNVGIGRRGNVSFGEHLKGFIEFLQRRRIITDISNARWHGHAYFGSGVGLRPVIGPGILLVGDAAGLAYPESGEGIKPAIESGRLAAETLIAAAGQYRTEDLQPYADALQRLHPAVHENPAPVRAALAAAGRLLLRSRAFTRHVVLDRWFLRATPSHSTSTNQLAT